MQVNYLAVCGMRRSGSTLHYFLAKTLIEQAGRGVGLWYMYPDQFANRRDEFDRIAGIKVVKVHLPSPGIALALERDEAVGLYTYRDLGDVLVSIAIRECYQAHHWLDDETWMIATVREMVRSRQYWLAKPNMRTLAYADLIADVPGEVQRIAQQVELKITPGQAQDIATKCSPRNLVAHAGLPQDHVNDGRAGMWESHVTPEQAARITRVIKHYGEAGVDY